MFRTFLSKLPKKTVPVMECVTEEYPEDTLLGGSLSAQAFGANNAFEDVSNLETTQISPEEAWKAGAET
jgi:hypothetical protein